MSNDYAWSRYADLQERSRTACSDDYSWGLESALNFLLNAIEANTVPNDPAGLDAMLKRTVASGGRLHRSRALALRTWMIPPESVPTDAAADATIELMNIRRAVNREELKVLLDAGHGYTDREIADRHASTPGAIRVRLSRLRHRLSGTSSETRRARGKSPANAPASFASTYQYSQNTVPMAL